MEIILFFSGLIAGIAACLVVVLPRASSDRRKAEADFFEADKQKGILNDRVTQLSSTIHTLEAALTAERSKSEALNTRLTTQLAVSQNLVEKLETQKTEIEAIHKKFSTEFENLSNKILDEKSRKFTEQNRTNLDVILNPFKERLKEFEAKVDKTYSSESAERNTLKGEIKSLMELNKHISEEAGNLARALKGDTKKQGNWGEMILERILERSGLMKGSEYDLQFSTSNEDGRRIQPDVIVFLPDRKHLIIDAKVSLVAYDAFVNAPTDEERKKFLEEHIHSVKTHIRNLSEKNYASSHDLNTPDFVLIFMPIESSFGIAIQADNELFNFAWDRKIVLVSPSTLLATLKTISAIWKQERQTRNALEIARLGGSLYDKFAGFLKDMDGIGDKLNAARLSHAEAMKKLSSGPGNVIKRVDELKKLGAKATKEIPLNHLDSAEENDAIQNT